MIVILHQLTYALVVIITIKKHYMDYVLIKNILATSWPLI